MIIFYATLIVACWMQINLAAEVPSVATRCSKKGKSFVSVQSGKQIESNGCSIPSFVKLAEDSPDFTDCCHLHDACYETCGERREYCDADFKTCMNNMCKRLPSSSKSSCLETANMFHMGVSMFGTSGFDESQRDWCTCAKKDSLIDHYTHLLTGFYEKYSDRSAADRAVTTDSNGESVDTSAVTMEPADIIPPTVRQNITLFAGAGGQSKFGRLYYKLHKKYAAAIKHVAKV